MAADRSLLEVRQAAPWAVLTAGCALVGHVEVLDDDGHAVDAWVHGEGDHIVRMARVGYGDVACTCGADRMPWCAHAVAVALTMLHDGRLETGEALARFAARADAMARLVEAEEALAVEYAAVVDEDSSAFADLLVDLRGRVLDRQIVGALSGPSADDARRMLRHLEQAAAERVDGAEFRSRGLAALEQLMVVVAYADLDPATRARAAAVLYPRARPFVGGSWTRPGWRVFEMLARMLEAGVGRGDLDPLEVACVILEAEAGWPEVVGGRSVLGRIGSLLGPAGIGRALAVGVAGGEAADGAQLGSMSHCRRGNG